MSFAQEMTNCCVPIFLHKLNYNFPASGVICPVLLDSCYASMHTGPCADFNFQIEFKLMLQKHINKTESASEWVCVHVADV